MEALRKPDLPYFMSEQWAIKCLRIEE